jgi:hypothetical protein
MIAKFFIFEDSAKSIQTITVENLAIADSLYSMWLRQKGRLNDRQQQAISIEEVERDKQK